MGLSPRLSETDMVGRLMMISWSVTELCILAPTQQTANHTSARADSPLLAADAVCTLEWQCSSPKLLQTVGMDESRIILWLWDSGGSRWCLVEKWTLHVHHIQRAARWSRSDVLVWELNPDSWGFVSQRWWWPLPKRWGGVGGLQGPIHWLTDGCLTWK